MSSLPHPVPSRISHNIAALYGHADDTLVAWQRACVQAAEALRPQPDPERLAKALALAQDGHVVLEDDGSATVQGSGPEPYTLCDGLCDCPDAKKRGLPCKHALAVQIHQQAAFALMPSASPAAPLPAPTTLPPKTRQGQPRRSAAWDVQEAPISSCLKLRDEAELRARFAEFRALVHDMAAELNDLALHLEAAHLTLREALERKRAAAQAAPAPQAAAAASPTPEALQQAIVQAVQATLAAQQAAHNGSQANGQGQAKPSDQDTGWCSLHDCAMEERENAGGTWRSHWLADEERWCKGARASKGARR